MQIGIQTEKKLTKPASQPCCSPSLTFATPATSFQVLCMLVAVHPSLRRASNLQSVDCTSQHGVSPLNTSSDWRVMSNSVLLHLIMSDCAECRSRQRRRPRRGLDA